MRDEAAIIAAIDAVLRSLGSAEFRHYMPASKSAAIGAMRAVLANERDICVAALPAKYTEDQGIDAEMASYNDAIDACAAAIRKGAL